MALEYLVLMVACLSLWATSFKLSTLAYTFDEFLNVAIGILQRANTPTAYRSSSAQLSFDQRESVVKMLFSKLTNDSPVPRTWDTQHLDLNGPPTMYAQRRQPYPIECVRAACSTFSAAEVERLGIDGTEWYVPRAIESCVEGPCAAWDGEVSGCEGASR